MWRLPLFNSETVVPRRAEKIMVGGRKKIFDSMTVKLQKDGPETVRNAVSGRIRLGLSQILKWIISNHSFSHATLTNRKLLTFQQRGSRKKRKLSRLNYQWLGWPVMRRGNAVIMVCLHLIPHQIILSSSEKQGIFGLASWPSPLLLHCEWNSTFYFIIYIYSYKSMLCSVSYCGQSFLSSFLFVTYGFRHICYIHCS